MKLIEYKPDYKIMSWVKIERERKYRENLLRMKFIEHLEKNLNQKEKKD